MSCKYIFSCIFLSVICIACSDSDEPETKSEACIDVEYNETFAVEVDGQYCFPDGTELKVNAFRNDFCPCNVICVWQGQMVIEMEWTDGTEVVEFEYQSDDNPNFDNSLPNGAVISDLDEDIEFITPCTDANPSPEIIGAKITVTR